MLVEKPITETAEEARELIALAARQKLILQVGHLERFNAAILAAEPYLHSPRFIECHRLAPYRERGTDVNVVLDLMIHDIDIVQTMVGAPIATIDAVGTPVFSEEIDICNARIRFANGCVANATASRVSLKTERKMRVFEDDAYLSLDLQQKILTLIRKRSPTDAPGPLPVNIEEQSLEQGDALKAEIESFLDCIRTGRPPVVSGEAGLMALETAMRITEQVHKSLAERRPSANPAAFPTREKSSMSTEPEHFRRTRARSRSPPCRCPATGMRPAISRKRRSWCARPPPAARRSFCCPNCLKRRTSASSRITGT